MTGSQLFYNLALLATAISTFWGGRSERIGAFINLSASVVSGVLVYIDLSYWKAGDATMWAIDLAVMVSFFVLATRSPRFWPVWAFGFALADINLRIAGMMLGAVRLLATSSAEVGCAYLALVALVAGVYEHRRWGIAR